MKKLLKITTVIVASIFLFAACEKEVTLTVPAGDVFIDLGEAFDPLTGVEVEGADKEDINVSWNPEFNTNVVNQYVVSYEVKGETGSRNVFVTADKLAGTYVVVDEEPDFISDEYTVTVVAVGEYNELRFDKWLYESVSLITGVVNGDVIEIPSQDFKVDDFDVTISGTGTYDGAAKKIKSINYTLVEDGDTYTGVSTFK